MALAADDAVRVLRGGPPHRIRSDDSYEGDGLFKAPLAWLRENGRYLLPTGSGDAIYVMALGLRNWISVHCVIGTVMVALVSLLMLLRALAASRGWGGVGEAYAAWEGSLLEAARCAYLTENSAYTDRIWWSTLSVLWVLPMLTCGLVLGTAFWLVHEDTNGRSYSYNWGVMAMGGIGVAGVWIASTQWDNHFGALLHRDWPHFQAQGVQQGEVLRMAVVLTVSAVALAATLVYVALVAPWWPSAAKQRVALTRGLAASLTASLVIAAVAVIDTLGQTLYLTATHGQGAVSTLSPAGLAGALAWLAQRLAKKDSARVPGVRKMPLKSLAGIAGVLIFVLVGALWAMLVHMMVWGGQAPAREMLFRSTQTDILGWLLWAPLAIALATGLFPGFINMSSLQPFYSSRLTRAYLGASNGQRFLGNKLARRSAAEPMASDQVRLTDYYADKKIKTLAPLHIINVCVNKTVDPAEQLVQRDRKGQPLAVLPCGLALDAPRVLRFPDEKKWSLSTVDRPLTVGQWIGTSGAAFSTGIGRETTLGMSLLMGAANVRLGTWWPTGQGRARPLPMLPPNWAESERLHQAAGLVFRTQRYLSYELRARFHGAHRTWQYLSDGGHFENTGLYELLRPQRRVAQIFACDSGADPAYQFDDLANLIRLARIDLRIDVAVEEPPVAGPLAGLFGRPEDFKAGIRPSAAPGSPKAASAGAELAPPAVSPARPASQGPIAVLLYASPVDSETAPRALIQIVLIKPHVTAGLPADVRQYAVTHPSFPQEPTADQFFDEAQWESYRALGYQQARRIFTREVLDALDAHRREWRPPAQRPRVEP